MHSSDEATSQFCNECLFYSLNMSECVVLLVAFGEQGGCFFGTSDEA